MHENEANWPGTTKSTTDFSAAALKMSTLLSLVDPFCIRRCLRLSWTQPTSKSAVSDLQVFGRGEALERP